MIWVTRFFFVPLRLVTMFICMYDLKQGRIEYCNAGHNPPVIGNAEGQYAFLDVKEPNAPIGLWPDLEYVGEEIDVFNDSMMLLYNDDLTMLAFRITKS